MSEDVDFSEAIVVDDGIMDLQVHINRDIVQLRYGDTILASSNRTPSDGIWIELAPNGIKVSHHRPRANCINMYAKGAVLYGDQYQVNWNNDAEGYITRVRI